MKVEDLMTKEVITLSPDDSLHEAAKKLRENKISGAPVVDGERVVGILSEADLLKALEEEAPEFKTLLPSPLDLLELPFRIKLSLDEATKKAEMIAKLRVRDVMSRNAITISPDADISEAARIMRERNINRLPVVDNGKLVGIITRADLLRAL